MRKIGKLLLVLSLSVMLLVPGLASAAEVTESTTAVKTDAQTSAELGLLVGDGNGVDDEYLAKDTTRIQAAIISLRMQGKLDEASAYTGKGNFADADQVGASNQAILAYLHNNPQYGWNGEGANRFNPLAPVSSQQLYKVLLEIQGYESNKDFAYQDTESFAAGKGMNQIAGVSELTNAHVSTALVESLYVSTPKGQKLFDQLQKDGIIAASAKLPEGERIGLRTDAKLGTILVDGKGRTLYFFSKDAQNLDACQGPCLANWPFLSADQLQIPSTMNPKDFSLVTHASGAKQWMYKGWPLYTFAKDKQAGDTLGEGVQGVWFAAKPDYRIMLGSNSELGTYLTDDQGRTLYYFAKDKPETSNCAGECIAKWPAYDVVDGSVPSTLNKADFGSITRPDGSKQATYKGYPLYYFAKDVKHGDTTGQNVMDVWFVVDPAK
ncbi:hypothetical protein [Paenibacillus marinisediminis]